MQTTWQGISQEIFDKNQQHGEKMPETGAKKRTTTEVLECEMALFRVKKAENTL